MECAAWAAFHSALLAICGNMIPKVAANLI